MLLISVSSIPFHFISTCLKHMLWYCFHSLCPLSRWSRALTYPEPLGPPRLVAGHIYFLLLPNCWTYRALKILYPKHVTDFSKFYSLSFYFNLPEAHSIVLFSFFVPVVHCFQLSLQWCSFRRDKPDFCMFVSVLSSFHTRMESRTSTSFWLLCGKVAWLPNLGIFFNFA